MRSRELNRWLERLARLKQLQTLLDDIHRSPRRGDVLFQFKTPNIHPHSPRQPTSFASETGHGHRSRDHHRHRFAHS